MYSPISVGHKGFFVLIVILAAIFVIIYGNNVYGAQVKKSPTNNYGFKSEEELLDETRAAVEKHLNDTKELRAEKKKVVEEEPLVEEAPAAKEESAKGAEEKPALAAGEIPGEAAPAEGTEPALKTEKITPDITTIKKIPFLNATCSFPSHAVGEPVLKRMDVNRIGADVNYETYQGFRLLKYFTVAQRVEIYEEPRPIDSYILDAFAMRIIYPNTPWNIKSDYRTQITPIFTRAYGTEITMSNPKNPTEALIRYTHDYRDIYKNYWPKNQYQNTDLKEESWDQNEVLLMHSKEIDPLGWLYTSNLGYRYSTLSAISDQNYYQIRHTYFGSLSLAPTDKLEYFFQGEYYKSMHLHASFHFSPDHFLGRTEVRIKSNDYKTTFVPQFSYSKDLFYPFWNTFEKYEIAFRAGRDWTKKFSTTSTVQFVYSYRNEPDNQGPNLYNTSFNNPHQDKGEYISLENRFSYNVYDRLYVQAGLDIANGLNWSIFDNWGILGGLEYYAPGIIRVDVGWRGNHYYALDKYLSSVYFKFYLFM